MNTYVNEELVVTLINSARSFTEEVTSSCILWKDKEGKDFSDSGNNLSLQKLWNSMVCSGIGENFSKNGMKDVLKNE